MKDTPARRRKMPGVGILGWVAGLAAAGSAQAQEAPLVFEREIYPIFELRCSSCHFPEAEMLEGKLDLSTYATTLRGGTRGPLLIPGQGEASPFVRMLRWEIDPPMPPPKKSRRLPGEEVDRIARWIDEGMPTETAQGALLLAALRGQAGAIREKGDRAPKAVPEEPEPGSAAAPAPSISPHAVEPDEARAPVSAIAFAPTSDLIARGRLERVELLEIKEGGELEVLRRLEGHGEMVRALAFSADGKLLAAGGGKPGRAGEVRLWRMPEGEPARVIEGHRDNVFDVAFSPDGRLLATCSYDKLIKLWNVETGEELRTLKNHIDAVYAIEFSPDGRALASASGDRTVKVWDVETGALVLTLSDVTQSVYAVAFSPDGRHVAAASADKMIRVWDLARSAGATFSQTQITNGVLAGSTFAHDGAVIHLLYSPDGARLISTGEDLTIKVWDAETLEERLVFEPQSDWVSALAVSPDGERLAVGRYDASTAIYDTREGRLLAGANPVRRAPAPAMATASASEGKTDVLDVGAVFIRATIPPSLDSLSTTWLHRGQELEWTVRGMNLDGAEPHVSHPAIAVELIENEALPLPAFRRQVGSTGAQIVDNAQPHRLKLRVTVAEDAPIGRHSLSFRTPRGLSEGFGFDVLARPDIAEVEPNDQRETAQAIQGPGVVAGRLRSAGDVDVYRLPVAAGEEWVAVVTDTSARPTLRLVDADGRTLATSREFEDVRRGVVGYRFPADGECWIEISDEDLREGSYRLHVGAFPLVTRLFPLGVAAGAARRVELAGLNVGPTSSLELKPPERARYGETMELPLATPEGSPIRPPRLAVGSAPEMNEVEPNDRPDQASSVPAPSVINGALAEGDVDLFRLAARGGERIVLEVMASRLGSPLDSVLDVLDAGGSPILRAQVRVVAETTLTLAGRDSRSAGIRIENWTDFKIDDYAMVGSEIIRLRDLPDYGDEDATFYAYPNGQRRGYFGTTPEHHAVGAPVYKVELHPPGAEFAPNGFPTFPLYWRNDDAFINGAYGGDALLEFTAPADGEYLIRVRDAHGRGGERYAYRLLLRDYEPDFTISVGPSRPNLAPASALPLTVRIQRKDDFAGAVRLRIEGLPDGFEADEATALEREDEIRLALRATAAAVSTPMDASFVVIGESELGGEPVRREARLGPITVTAFEPDLRLAVDRPTLELDPGRSVWITVRIARANDFEGRVPLDVLNLPFGVRVLDTGLNGILVPPGQTERAMEIYAEPWVTPMSRLIYPQAAIETASGRSLVFLGSPIRLAIGPARPTETPARPPTLAARAPDR